MKEEDKKEIKKQPLGKKCGCGRSPNGYCIGWHSLSVEDFEDRQEKYQTGRVDLRGKDIE